eukprot:14672862-Ditylum_brightwellii.AAC.1
MEADFASEFSHWASQDMKNDVQVAVHSSLALDANIAILNAPRSEPKYRLPPQQFLLSLNCHLVLPIHSCCRRCLCGAPINL